MKKMISLVLSLAMICCVISVPASASSTTDKDSVTLVENEDGFFVPASEVFTRTPSEAIVANLVEDSQDLYQDEENHFYSRAKEDLYIPMKQVVIDATDTDRVENAISENGIKAKTAAEVRAYSQECQAANVADASVTVYVPYSVTRASGVGPYTGYGNKQYYYEVTQYNHSASNDQPINQSYSDYFDQGVEVTLDLLANGILDSVTCGIFSIASSYISSYLPPSLPSNGDYTLVTDFMARKNSKNMYVYENSQYYFGSHTEYVINANFENRFLDASQSRSYTLPEFLAGAEMTDNYSNSDAEERAYYSYLGSGWTEYLSGYWYGDAYFELN